MKAQQHPGYPHFHWEGGSLHAEQVRVQDLAHAHGTPLFVYSKAAMLQALAAYQRGFAGRSPPRPAALRSLEFVEHPTS